MRPPVSAGVSNCLPCQAAGAVHGVLVRIRALTIVSRLCIQAVSATFFGFPAATSRVEKARITTLRRAATSAPMSSPARPGARPPQTRRRPHKVPLSRANGATPTRAAICWRVRRPSSGRWATRVRLTTGPMPGTRRSRSSVARQAGQARIAWSMSWSTSLSWRSSHWMCFWNVLLEAAADRRQSGPQAVALGGEPLDQRPAARQEARHELRIGAGQWPRGGPNALGTEGQDVRVEVVGLGQLAGGAGEVAHLAGIGDDDGQSPSDERGDERGLVAAGGFEDDERGTEPLQLLDEAADAGLVVGDGGRGARGALDPDELGLGDVDADDAGGHKSYLLRERPRPRSGLRDAGCALATVRALDEATGGALAHARSRGSSPGRAAARHGVPHYVRDLRACETLTDTSYVSRGRME